MQIKRIWLVGSLCLTVLGAMLAGCNQVAEEVHAEGDGHNHTEGDGHQHKAGEEH